MENKKYWIWFSLIEGLGPIKKQEMLAKFGTPERIYNLNEGELLGINGIGEKLARNILNKNIRENLEKHIKYMQENKIDIISINDEQYPKILKEIYDYPISLYIKGNKEILNNLGVAIVGCRELSEYGKKAAKYFAYHLSRQGKNIVSGLARGVDSYAHIGNIYAQKELNSYINKEKDYGKTIAVVGNGLDIIYPSENQKLSEEIINTGGAIVSEYPLGTKVNKLNFPARNRIISGLSEKLIVVEAKKKSGTLITVDFALEQGRDVFVVPGNINSINSVGTNDLIKQGAKIATTYLDIY